MTVCRDDKDRMARRDAIIEAHSKKVGLKLMEFPNRPRRSPEEFIADVERFRKRTRDLDLRIEQGIKQARDKRG